MKKYISSLFGGLVTIVMVSSFLTGCSITDPTTDLKVHISMPATGAVIGGQITNSNGIPITTPVAISISGPDAGAIVDLLNQRVTTLNTSSGFVAMAVNDSIPVSVDDPVRFTLTLTADGYLPAIKSLLVFDQGGTTFQIKMISSDINNLPDGLVGAKETASTSGSGKLSSPLNIASPTNPTSGTSTGLSIPAGSRFLDADGNPLTGNITATLIFGDLASDTLRRANEYLPGDQNRPVTADGNSLAPLSFFSLVVVDASGHLAASIDSPVDLVAQIPGGTFNNRTRALFAAGDTVTYCAIDTNGVWQIKAESVTTGPDGNGNFTVRFSADNLLLPGSLKGSNAGIDNARDLGFRMEMIGEEIQRYNNEGDITQKVYWPAARGHRVYVYISARNPEFDVTCDVSSDGLFTIPNVRKDIQDDDVGYILTCYWRNLYYRHIQYTGNTPDSIYVGDAWPWGATKSVTCHIFAKMPDGRDPSEIRPSGLSVVFNNDVAEGATDANRWISAGNVQNGMIVIHDLDLNSNILFRGTYTFQGQTRTANTPWTRQITAQTDTLQYWYQLSDDEADEYANGG